MERYTYTQQMAEQEIQHNLNTTTTTNEELQYDTAEGQFIGLVMDHYGQQYSLNKGLKVFKEEGEAAIKKEIKQMLQQKSFTPILVSELTKSERLKSQNAITMLTEKKDGTKKDELYSTGNQQENGYPEKNRQAQRHHLRE